MQPLGAPVVPVNSMNLLEEVRHIVADSGSRVALFGQELAPHIVPLLGSELDHAISACYGDYLRAATDLPIPEGVDAPRAAIAGVVAWRDALAAGHAPEVSTAGPQDLAVIPYTS
ncbi:MAG TPA: hypothetical protein VK325_08705, partial [Pseudoxanthomonas sp.]|nr:hypothetical protein [Pseudoxanthomonas sp.]